MQGTLVLGENVLSYAPIDADALGTDVCVVGGSGFGPYFGSRFTASKLIYTSQLPCGYKPVALAQANGHCAFSCSSNVSIVSVGVAGKTQWSQKTVQVSDISLPGMARLADGDLVLAGYGQLPGGGGYRLFALRVSGSGNKVWEYLDATPVEGDVNFQHSLAIWQASSDGNVALASGGKVAPSITVVSKDGKLVSKTSIPATVVASTVLEDGSALAVRVDGHLFHMSAAGAILADIPLAGLADSLKQQAGADLSGSIYYRSEISKLDTGYLFSQAQNVTNGLYAIDGTGAVLWAKPQPSGSAFRGVSSVNGILWGLFTAPENKVKRWDRWGNDVCVGGGLCIAKPWSGCADGTTCTTDACDVKLGCTHTPHTNPCTDKNPCTATDTCTSGTCKGTPSPAPTCAMAVLPASTISQGCNASVDSECNPDESPTRSVTLAAFALDLKEVSNLQYTACLSAGKCTTPATSSTSCTYGKSGKDAFPVNCVTYDQAVSYCKWAHGDGRLPTEAEWERAARSTDARKYPWGNSAPDTTRANFAATASKAVGSFVAGKSVDGLSDLAGNVSEWVSDWYDAAAYAVAAAPNPTGPTGSTARVVRGGNYQSGPAGIRGGARGAEDPAKAQAGVGFRCARSGN